MILFLHTNPLYCWRVSVTNHPTLSLAGDRHKILSKINAKQWWVLSWYTLLRLQICYTKHLVEYKTDVYSDGNPMDAICSRRDLSTPPHFSGCTDTKVGNCDQIYCITQYWIPEVSWPSHNSYYFITLCYRHLIFTWPNQWQPLLEVDQPIRYDMSKY